MSRSPSFSVKPELPSPKIDPKSLNRWVVAFCVIRFDLEQGQLIEECFPSGSLTQEEELEISFSSFPDSVSQHQNRSSIHDCIFFFRSPRRGNGSSSEIVEVDDGKQQSSRRFLKGQNFMPWFQRRRAVAEQEQHRLWRQARLKTDIQQFISEMSELEMVDSFNAIEKHLLGEMQSGKAISDSAAAWQKLKGDLETVFNILPKDVQQSLLLNPQRAALLQGSGERTKLPGHPLAQVRVISSTSPR